MSQAKHQALEREKRMKAQHRLERLQRQREERRLLIEERELSQTPAAQEPHEPQQTTVHKFGSMQNTSTATNAANATTAAAKDNRSTAAFIRANRVDVSRVATLASAQAFWLDLLTQDTQPHMRREAWQHINRINADMLKDFERAGFRPGRNIEPL